MKVFSHYNYSAEGRKEVRDPNKVGEVKVVPDQSLKIRDVLSRFVKGLPLDMDVQKGVYPDEVSHDSPDMEALKRLDKMEKLDLARGFTVRLKQPKNDELSDGENRPKAGQAPVSEPDKGIVVP